MIRQVTPGGTCAVDPQNSVNHHSIVPTWPCPATTFSWKQRHEQRPLLLRQFDPFHAASTPKSSLESDHYVYLEPFEDTP